MSSNMPCQDTPGYMIPHQSNGCNSSVGFSLCCCSRYSGTCCCCCCSTSKFKFSVCAKEVWMKALLIPGEQMQAACLMLMPSYQDKMAEVFYKQHKHVCLWCSRGNDHDEFVGWWYLRSERQPGCATIACQTYITLHQQWIVKSCDVLISSAYPLKTLNKERQKERDWLQETNTYVQIQRGSLMQ